MEYTIRAKDEFNAEAHRQLYSDFSWMRNVDPSLFFDKEVAAKVLRWANADSESDAFLIKYFITTFITTFIATFITTSPGNILPISVCPYMLYHPLILQLPQDSLNLPDRKAKLFCHLCC